MEQDENDRPALTPAMIEAGRDALLAGVNWSSDAPLWIGPYSAADIARDVFEAMLNARSA